MVPLCSHLIVGPARGTHGGGTEGNGKAASSSNCQYCQICLAGAAEGRKEGTQADTQKRQKPNI